MPYPRIHDGDVIYFSEMKTNLTEYTRFDWQRAQPDDQTLYWFFVWQAVLNGIAIAFTLLLLLAILRSEKVRSVSFNWYVLFVTLSDFIASVLCCWTCAASAHNDGKYYSEWMCGFQSFYLNFNFTSNCWLNGVIVYQIHTLLKSSNIRRRYKPPTHKQVIIHSMAVYLYAIFIGFLNAFNLPFLPYSTHLYYGFVCMPQEYDLASTLFFWLVHVQIVFGIPINYLSYVVMDIYKHKLLPPAGRRRKLSLFLLRLVSIFFLAWTPFLIAVIVSHFVPVGTNVTYYGGYFAHLQAIISVIFVLSMNEDARKSAMLILQLKPSSCEFDDDDDLFGEVVKRRMLRRRGGIHITGGGFKSGNSNSRNGIVGSNSNSNSNSNPTGTNSNSKKRSAKKSSQSRSQNSRSRRPRSHLSSATSRQESTFSTHEQGDQLQPLPTLNAREGGSGDDHDDNEEESKLNDEDLAKAATVAGMMSRGGAGGSGFAGGRQGSSQLSAAGLFSSHFRAKGNSHHRGQRERVSAAGIFSQEMTARTARDNSSGEDGDAVGSSGFVVASPFGSSKDAEVNVGGDASNNDNNNNNNSGSNNGQVEVPDGDDMYDSDEDSIVFLLGPIDEDDYSDYYSDEDMEDEEYGAENGNGENGGGASDAGGSPRGNQLFGNDIELLNMKNSTDDDNDNLLEESNNDNKQEEEAERAKHNAVIRKQQALNKYLGNTSSVVTA